MERRTFALLIAGHEPIARYEQQFIEQTLEWRDYLIDEADFDPARVRVYCNPFWNIEVLDHTDDFFDYVRAEDPGQDVVVMYNGHGLEGRFCPSSGNSPIRYEELAVRINHPGRTLFVNDTCHSGSAIPIFRKHGLIPRGSVLASSKGNEKSYSSVYARTLLDAFRRHKPYRRQKIEFETVKLVGVYENSKVKKFRPTTKLIGKRLIEERTKLIQHPRRMGTCLDHLLFPQ